MTALPRHPLCAELPRPLSIVAKQHIHRAEDAMRSGRISAAIRELAAAEKAQDDAAYMESRMRAAKADGMARLRRSYAERHEMEAV